MLLESTGTSAMTRQAAGTPRLNIRAGDWRTRVIQAYHRSRPDGVTLAGELVAALHQLTGRAPDPDTIVVDPAGPAAWGSVDGVRFRWNQGQLVTVRPCAHCGHGSFASQPLLTKQELGYALSVWQPLHTDCQPFIADDVD